MDTQTKARVTKDAANKKIKIVKDFDADIKSVWAAYTDRTKLDQWWAPKPWRAETKEMNFKEGGHWLYSMNGPKGERQWAKMDFEKINAPNQFTQSILLLMIRVQEIKVCPRCTGQLLLRKKKTAPG